MVVPGPLEWRDQRTLTAGLSRPAAGIGVGAWIWETGEIRLPAGKHHSQY